MSDSASRFRSLFATYAEGFDAGTYVGVIADPDAPHPALEIVRQCSHKHPSSRDAYNCAARCLNRTRERVGLEPK